MRNRRGVSLVELLIAITVISFLGVSMVKLLRTNALATEHDDLAREARSVSRAGLNLLESELRPIEPDGIISPTNSTTLTMREPYAFGVICSISGGTTIALLPSSELPSSLVVGGKAGWAWRNTAGLYEYEVTTTLGNGTASTCTAQNITPLTAQGGKVITTAAPTVGTPKIGAIAFLYRQITYSISASTSAPGKLALFRTEGGGTPTELAAPFGATARFRWYILDEITPSDTLPTELRDLRGVQFVFPGESRRTVRMSGQVASTPFTTSIFFQNRPN